MWCFSVSARGPSQPPFSTAIRELLNKHDSEHVSWFPSMLTVREEHLPVAGRPGLAPDDSTSLTSCCSLKLPGPPHSFSSAHGNPYKVGSLVGTSAAGKHPLQLCMADPSISLTCSPKSAFWESLLGLLNQKQSLYPPPVHSACFLTS